MKFHLFIILVLCCFINISAQLIPNPTAGKTAEAEAAEAKINKITKEAGIYFKQGLLGLQDDRRPQARADFDKSIEVFLLSGVNIRSNAKLQGCYSQLIETVYRIEYPSGQIPQIRNLAATCGWDIDNQLADNIAKLSVRPIQTPITSRTEKDLTDSVAGRQNKTDIPSVGFSDQKFDPSPLDELAKLELTPEEQRIENKFRVIKAQAGDTVAKIAARAGVSAVEIAKFNGLFPDSILTAGREIRIPYKSNNVGKAKQTLTRIPKASSVLPAGPKPVQRANGIVLIVVKYLYDTLNDPYSVRYVKWSPVLKVSLNGYECWAVVLKLRAKNVFNAYILGEMIFYIHNNKVVQVARLS